MNERCDLGRKTCQWSWGKRICAGHCRIWLEGLRKALVTGRPVQLRNGKWVLVRETKPALRVVS